VTDIQTLAIRFADLWAVDHHQMVDEIYSPGIHMEPMARLHSPAVEGSDQLHALEDRLASLIPAHRHELVRVVAEKRHACLETTVLGPETGEYAPACVWWWPDARGQVAREVGWFDWELRSTDSRRSHGFVPPNDHRRRGDRQWYLSFAEVLAAGMTTDPAATVARSFAPDVVIEHVGDSRCESMERALGALPPEHSIEVNEVAADGAVLAVLFTFSTAESVSRGTVVLTLDELDKIASLRAYWRWSTAVSLADVHPSIRLGRESYSPR
jgi:hypothetical protein